MSRVAATTSGRPHLVHRPGLGQLGGQLPLLRERQLQAGGRAHLGVAQAGEDDAEDDEPAAENEKADSVQVVPVRLEERCDEEDGAQEDEDDAAGEAGHTGMVSGG